MFAALTPDRKYLTVSVVNATDKAQKLDLNVSGARLEGPSTLWQLTGRNVDAANHIGQPRRVEIKEMAIGDVPKSLSVAPISINIYRFPMRVAQ